MSHLKLRVARLDDRVPGVRTLSLVAEGGGPLPVFVPGSHLLVECAGKANAYSLTGDGTHPSTYEISVLRVADGAGGSRWLHDAVREGDVLAAHLPRSAFPPVARAAKHLLVAGGIGVTPVVSHLRAARTWGRQVQVLYAARPDRAAHVDDVLELAGADAELVADRHELTARLDKALGDQPIGTHLYVCGPPGLIDHVLDTAAGAGWPPSRLHSERFGTDALDPGDPFAVTVKTTGRTLSVPSGTSLLDALEQADLAVPNLCRQGVCGQCRITVTGGRPLHRDLFLTDEEKASGDALMACVSRADGPTLEVSL